MKKEVTGCSLFQEQRLKRISCQRLIKKGKKQNKKQNKEQTKKKKNNNTPHTSRHKWGTREGCFDVAQHGLSANISVTFQAALNFSTYTKTTVCRFCVKFWVIFGHFSGWS